LPHTVQQLIGCIFLIFLPTLSFGALVWGDSFRIYGKALRFLKLECSRQLMVKIWWSYLALFWLIHPCDGWTDGRTDRIVMAKTRDSSLAAFSRKNCN